MSDLRELGLGDFSEGVPEGGSWGFPEGGLDGGHPCSGDLGLDMMQYSFGVLGANEIRHTVSDVGDQSTEMELSRESTRVRMHNGVCVESRDVDDFGCVMHQVGSRPGDHDGPMSQETVVFNAADDPDLENSDA